MKSFVPFCIAMDRPLSMGISIIMAITGIMLGFAKATFGFQVDYPHSITLDPNGDYMVSWTFSKTRIEFETHVRTTGYVGFGVSMKGEMRDSDLIIGGVDAGGHLYFTDRHGTGHTEPTLDDRQDWYVISGRENATHTILRFGRPLDSCDPMDLAIKTETVRIIWSFGTDDPDMDGGATYHRKRGTTSVFLLTPQTPPPTPPGGSFIADFINPQVELPADHTTYWCQAFPLPVSIPHQVIQFEPIIEPGHESLVHHIIIYGCFNESRDSSIGMGHVCYHDNMPDEWWECNAVMFAWAIGGGGFIEVQFNYPKWVFYFPDHVGYPFGADGDPTFLLMETHYDNPQLTPGVQDSSGLRMTLTPRSRQFDAGIISVGSLVWRTQVIPPYMPRFRTDGHCHEECLTQALEGSHDSIHVFGGILHSHLLGVAMRVRHFRSGKELPNVLRDDNYDFNLQETRLLQKEITLKSGDHLTTECFYDTTNKTTVTFGGQSTSEEMCLGYLIYYPRIQLTNCESSVQPRTLAEFALANMGELPLGLSSRRFSWANAFLNHINWTDHETREAFQEISTSPDHTVLMRCQQGPTQYRAQGKSRMLPVLREPLIETDICLRYRLEGNSTTKWSSDNLLNLDNNGTYDRLHPVVNTVTAVVRILGANTTGNYSVSEDQIQTEQEVNMSSALSSDAPREGDNLSLLLTVITAIVSPWITAFLFK